MIIMSREEFATKRFDRQEQAIETLTPVVARALDNYAQEDWWRPLLAPTRLLFNDVLREDSGDTVRHDVRAWSRLSAMLADTLPKTSKPDEYTAKTIATWLSTAAINWAAVTAADHDSEQLVMEWVTMHDSKVREAHKDTDGQQRPVGEKFDVDGVPMQFPGDTRAPIDLWINCRCAVRPAEQTTEASLIADAAARQTGRVIVALPGADDPATSLAQDEAHLTLVWLGKPEDNPDLDMAPIHAAVEAFAHLADPFTAGVQKVEPLGEDGAIVWLLAPDEPTLVHDRLLADVGLKAAHDAVKQFPNFTPHTTIGYDLVMNGDAIDALSEVESIFYDRLAVWDGENRAEYPLGGAMPDSQVAAVDSAAPVSAIPWHGVLAPEGVWSGDGRRFADGSLSFRDLPLPLTWQKVTAGGHDGSVTVAKIESIQRVGNMMQAEGHFVDTPETDEVVGLISDFGRYGVSVDADDAAFEYDDETDNVTFTNARISSASIVSIPAFAEAFIALGTWADATAPTSDSEAGPESGDGGDEGDPCDENSPFYDAEKCAQQQQTPPDAGAPAMSSEVFVSDKPWSQFTQADYTDQQWYSACVLHKNGQSTAKSDNGLPIKEPGGALNRNGVHAAAGRFNQVQASPEAKAAAARALRGAYATLGEDPPDAIKATGDTVAFGRGPGWITNPEDTRRLHDYWTVPGHEGYAKIGWGTDGDFARCKVEIGQEIAEEDPATVAKYMNQICAQWHHDATGFWPGHAPAETHRHSLDSESADAAPALSLVASIPKAPADWFRDPQFETLTPFTVTEDGQVFGHLCGWETCHVGFADTCVAPPRSASGYAYFLTGEVLTDDGPVPVGHVTLGGGHAGPGLSMRGALAHYDSTSSVVADVTCGDDEHGIWLAGWVRPGTTDAQVYALRAAPLSGDWRTVRSEYELIAALAVNSPGFPIPRVAAGIVAGRQVSLVAAGVLPKVEPEPQALTPEQFARAVVAEMHAVEKRRERLAALRARHEERVDV